MARLNRPSSALLLKLLLVCLGVAGISAFVGTSAGAATLDAAASALYRPSQPSMPEIQTQGSAKDGTPSNVIPIPPAGFCTAGGTGAAFGAYSDASGNNVTVCPASFLGAGNASAEGPSVSELQRLLGSAAGALDGEGASPAEAVSDTVTETVTVTMSGTAAQASHDNFTFEAQWDAMVLGVVEFADDLSYFAKEVMDHAMDLSASSELWGVRASDLFPYNAPLASAPLGGLPAYTDDVSSYAGAMSDYTASLAVAAAGLGGHAAWFLAFSGSIKEASDWSMGGDYTEYTSFMAGEVKYLATWAADLAAFSADWVENVEYQSLSYANSTIAGRVTSGVTVLSSSGARLTLDETARQLLDSTRELSAFAADWTAYAADMDIWAADWVSYTADYGVCQAKAADVSALPAGTAVSQ